MRVIPLTGAIAIALLASGCFLPTGPELNFTREKPSETELIGTWRPTAATLKDIHDRGRYAAAEHELILRSDHTLTIRNMPDWWRHAESHGRFESGDGTWELAPGNSSWQTWVLLLRFADYVVSVNLYHQRSPYLIYIELGDPDLAQGMLFERQKT